MIGTLAVIQTRVLRDLGLATYQELLDKVERRRAFVLTVAQQVAFVAQHPTDPTWLRRVIGVEVKR